MGDTHGQRGRAISNAVGTSQDMAKRGYTGEGTYQDQVGSGGKYDKPGITGFPPVSGTDMDYHGPPTKGSGVIHGNWSDGYDLEENHLHHKKLPKGSHIPT